MKKIKAALFVTLLLGVFLSLVFAEGYIEKGKELFNDPNFSGSINEKSCGSCHPGGGGLEKACSKKTIELFGQTANSLEDAVNLCITLPLEGTAIENDSQEMKDMVAYICSLKVKKPARRRERKYR